MATVSKLLLLLLCSYYGSLTAHARHGPSYKVPATGSLSPDAAVCSETKAIPSSGGATVPLHHRHGPCSPVPFKSKEMPTLEEMLRSDQLRTSYIQRKFSGAANSTGDVQQSAATVPTALGASLEYVITVGIGSPAVTQTMVIDTGSDVSWVRCTPCSQCQSQADPPFDPSSSSTYSPFSCSSPACTQLEPEQEGNGCSSSQQCQYIVNYGDGSRTTGTYSSDTLTLGSDAVDSFQFGCSSAESGFHDQTDGLMGLGGGAQSLVSQTVGTFGTAFSYCLPPTPASAGFLTLGASSGGSGFVTTPMTRSSQNPTYYQVVLEAIMVDGKQLDVPPSVFSAGAMMDSGTVVTWLPPTAYSALSSAFTAGMTQYPAAQPRGILDTCFDFGGQQPSSATVPPVSLVFAGGAVVNLDNSGIFSGNCLAFTANKDDSVLSIIGNVQQRTFEVLYDIGQSTVGFRAGAC